MSAPVLLIEYDGRAGGTWGDFYVFDMVEGVGMRRYIIEDGSSLSRRVDEAGENRVDGGKCEGRGTRWHAYSAVGEDARTCHW